jgi:hypothetical protein
MSSVVNRPVAARVAAIGAAFAVLIPLLAVPGAAPASAANCPSASTSTNYSGGAGTDGNPWQIATAADLMRLADPAQSGDWSGYFEQTADIDMAGCDWTPIALLPWWTTAFNRLLFTGTYDGLGHRVSNLSVDRSSNAYPAGLFGIVDGATIENIRVEIRTRGDIDNVGGLIGYVDRDGVTVRNVRTEIDAVGANFTMGGVIGAGIGPILIDRAVATGSISDTSGAGGGIGGIIGQYQGDLPHRLEIRDSVSSVSVAVGSGSIYVGGVLGLTGGSLLISGTTVNGSMSTDASDVGGVVGHIDWSTVEASISDVRVRPASVTGATAVGGVVGSVNRVDSLLIERTVVRSPVMASVADGDCLVGSFAAGSEEKATVVDSFSRSTVSVAGVVSQCPFPPDPEPAGPAFFAPGGVLPIVSPGLGEWVQADGSSTPLTVSSPGPNQVRYSADGVQVTFTGGAGSDASRGLVANPAGEVVCEICVALAAGQVIEVWMFSTPRLVAAHLIADLPCQRFTIPVVAPLDGGGPVSAGAHTLQLALPTASGMQAVNVGVTVGGPVPASVPAGEGPAVPAGLLLVGVAAAAFGLRRLAVGTAA